MPTYNFKCPGCENEFETVLAMSESKSPQACPECGIVADRILGGEVDFALNGDQWPGKAIKVRGQMAEKNRQLEIKQKERHAPIKLVPNVGGEKVGSWSEARKIAKGLGKESSSYDALVQKEHGG
jgi:putative FmdB family regulatory protein